MHAQVRAAMLRRPDWDVEAWDHPVNQIQLAGTLMLFSLVMLLGSRILGMRFSAADRAAAFHLWRYVGYLMGVHPGLLPVTEEDAWRLFWLEGATEFRPDADSARLARALLAASPRLLLPPRWKGSARAARMLVNYQGSYARLSLGRQNADMLGAPDTRGYRAAVVATAAGIFALETVRCLVPGATRLSERIGQRQRAALDQPAGQRAAGRPRLRPGLHAAAGQPAAGQPAARRSAARRSAAGRSAAGRARGPARLTG